MTPKWEICYYLTETAFRSGVPAFRETIVADRNYVVRWAQKRIQSGSFKFFDITEK